MGYTHYWYRPEHLDSQKFAAFAKDCAKIVMHSRGLGIDIAGGLGDGNPEITPQKVWFNGSDEQVPGRWTTQEQITIPWPADSAESELLEMAWEKKTAGTWYAGDLLSSRVAPVDNLTGKGSGSYETFAIDVYEKQSEWRKDEPSVFTCCKTGYRPYDLTVTACLVAFKHHFGDTVKVSSDGEMKDWIDGIMMCENLFSYGLDFKFPEPEYTEEEN